MANAFVRTVVHVIEEWFPIGAESGVIHSKAVRNEAAMAVEQGISNASRRRLSLCPASTAASIGMTA